MRFKNHSGRGTYFVGRRYQHGNGFFGNMLRNAIFPLLKYLGAKGVKAAVAIGREAVENPVKSLKEIAKRKLKESGIEVMDEGMGRLRKCFQAGGGVKRLRRSEGVRRVKRRRKSCKVVALPKRVPAKKRKKKLVKRGKKPLFLL